jgi:tripartite-type tricarboxylate transporter receptor subunit TctC
LTGVNILRNIGIRNDISFIETPSRRRRHAMTRRPGLTRRHFTALAIAAAGPQLAPSAFAQAGPYPNRPVKLIVSFPPGGVTDATFRRFGERFQALTGQPMVIENKPGRGVTPNALATAAPDGYTIGIVGRSQFALYYQLNGAVPYKPVDSFTWIASTVSSWFGLYVSASSPYKSVADIVAAAKAAPGALSYGTAFGHGGLSHVPMEDFARTAGIQMLHVPFRGDPDAAMQLMRGDIHMMVAGGSAMPFVQDGKLRVLAWLNSSRHPRLTTIPTMRELGYPAEVVAPVGVGGPAGMNPAHVAFLEQTFRKILSEKEIQEFLDRNYQREEFMTSAQFTEWAIRQQPIDRQITERFNLAEKAKP